MVTRRRWWWWWWWWRLVVRQTPSWQVTGEKPYTSPEADSGRSAYQASDRGSPEKDPESEERREYSNRSGGASPARARNLIGMGLNPREWSDGDGGIGDESPGEKEQLTESRMEEVREWMEEREENGMSLKMG